MKCPYKVCQASVEHSPDGIHSRNSATRFCPGLCNTTGSILIYCMVDTRTMCRPEWAVRRCCSDTPHMLCFQPQNCHLIGIDRHCSVDPVGSVYIPGYSYVECWPQRMLIACRVHHDLVIDWVWHRHQVASAMLSLNQDSKIIFLPVCVYHVWFIRVESDNGRVLSLSLTFWCS